MRRAVDHPLLGHLHTMALWQIEQGLADHPPDADQRQAIANEEKRRPPPGGDRSAVYLLLHHYATTEVFSGCPTPGPSRAAHIKEAPVEGAGGHDAES